MVREDPGASLSSHGAVSASGLSLLSSREQGWGSQLAWNGGQVCRGEGEGGALILGSPTLICKVLGESTLSLKT